MYIGRSIYKNFGEAGKYLGRITGYDPKIFCYSILYDDNDVEDLTAHEMQRVLISDAHRNIISKENSVKKPPKGPKMYDPPPKH